MDKTIFYAPDILKTYLLPEEESLHAVRVLRMQSGDEILITDGKGYFFDAVITNPHQKRCGIEITAKIESPKSWNYNIHLAFAPTKSIDRIEWFIEKATEVGIDHLTPLLCDHSERRQIKHDRLEKILISAIKQSQKAVLPQLDEMISFNEFIREDLGKNKLIAHCYEDETKLPLQNIYKKGEDVLILIGPEGDFSEEEVKESLENGFKSISLGKSRLRTETAALVACHSIHALNW